MDSLSHKVENLNLESRLELVENKESNISVHFPEASSYWFHITEARKLVHDYKNNRFLLIPSKWRMCKWELECLLKETERGVYTDYEEVHRIEQALRDTMTSLEELASKLQIKIMDMNLPRERGSIARQFENCILPILPIENHESSHGSTS